MVANAALVLDAGVDVIERLRQVREPLAVIRTDGGAAFAESGSFDPAALVAYVPGLAPESLGDRGLCADYGIRYACLSGSMANGIASSALAIAMGKAGMLGFFGTGGVPMAEVKKALDEIQAALGVDGPYGFNLLNNPTDPAHEEALIDLYIERGVRLAEASAYLRVTAPLVRYRLHGIHRGPDGQVVTPNRLIAKVSRAELATHFFAPAPDRVLKQLVEKGVLTAEQTVMAKEVPVAQDLTAEADSGGHTDNRPALLLVGSLTQLARQLQAEHRFKMPLRVGLGGGVATPASVAAAFTLGASYVMLGSVTQACVESGTSDVVRRLLAQAKTTDVAMAPSAALFEIGGQVQVLKRGTMFAMRANKLNDLYRSCASLEEIPEADRKMLEEKLFRASLETVWEQTRSFFAERDPKQLEKAERDPKVKMSLVFRAYLGQSSRWALRGDDDRQDDYQIWCGPAMGAFNEWVAGSFLEAVENRSAAVVALNLMHGAAMVMRLQSLRMQGVDCGMGLECVVPLDAEGLGR